MIEPQIVDFIGMVMVIYDDKFKKNFARKTLSDIERRWMGQYRSVMCRTKNSEMCQRVTVGHINNIRPVPFAIDHSFDIMFQRRQPRQTHSQNLET